MKICVHDGSVLLFFSYFIICSIPVLMLLSDKSWTDLTDHGYLVFDKTEVGRHVDMAEHLPTYTYMLTHLRRFFFSLVRYIPRDGQFRIYWDKNIYFWMGIPFLVSQRCRPYESNLFCQFLASKNISSPHYHLDASCDWKVSLNLEFSPERNIHFRDNFSSSSFVDSLRDRMMNLRCAESNIHIHALTFRLL